MNDDITTVRELRNFVQAFIAERDWQQFHDPKNLSMSMAIEVAELMEHFQWIRSDQLLAMREDDSAMGAVREELADVFCYLLSFSETMGIDLAAALEDKMKKNRLKYPAEEFKGRFRL